jgi:hypothetical protein
MIDDPLYATKSQYSELQSRPVAATKISRRIESEGDIPTRDGRGPKETDLPCHRDVFG